LQLIINTRDEQLHKKLKGPIALLFSLSNVVNFEGVIDEGLLRLSEQLDRRFVATGLKKLDFGAWLQYFAFDAMGTMTFSRQYGFVEQGYDIRGMLDAVYGFMKTLAPVCMLSFPRSSSEGS
jgi:hypothetical protein